MKVTDSIEIQAPAEKVWPFLIEPEKTKKWFTSLEKFEYTSKQHDGEGSTFYWEEKSGNRVYKLHFITTEWVPNRVFAYKMTSGDFFKSYTERWTLEPTTSGCKFSFNDEIEFPGGIFGKAIGASVKRRSIATGKEIMANLKRLAEVA